MELAVNKWLSVDHCHNTNKVRGLLCSRCNTALGLLKDDENTILNALMYVREGGDNVL